jgi:DNA-binding GntR family transcriptional regulator
MAAPSVRLGAPVDKNSPIPLYFQIAENLRTAIDSGRLRPGEHLENELQLCEHLGVSRPTVRQAIDRLVQDGLIQRQRGVGTVIVSRRINRRLALSSLFDDLEATKRHPKTTILRAEEVIADSSVAAALASPTLPSPRVILLERLRFADGEPLALMRNYLPLGILPDHEAISSLNDHGLYETLRRHGVRFTSADETIGARGATPDEARVLQVARGSTVLTVTRIARDPAGTPIEYGLHSYLADRYSFQVALGIE